MRRSVHSVGIALLLGGFVFSAQTSAQVKKGKERPLQTRHLMAGVVQPNCASLGKLLQGSGPTDDKGWDTAAQNAELLNEAGHALMADGRCPDGTWAGASEKMRDGSSAILKAIAEKNAESGRAAFGELTKSCASCHQAHRGK